MWYVYFLKNLKDYIFYIGSTCDLKRRILDHNSGFVVSTKNRRPLNLIGYRKFDTVAEAALFEKKYKRSSGQFRRDVKNGKIFSVGE